MRLEWMRQRWSAERLPRVLGRLVKARRTTARTSPQQSEERMKLATMSRRDELRDVVRVVE